MNEKLRVSLVGLNFFRYRYCLALRYLKAHVEARPDLAARTSIEVRDYQIGLDGGPSTELKSMAEEIWATGPIWRGSPATCGTLTSCCRCADS